MKGNLPTKETMRVARSAFISALSVTLERDRHRGIDPYVQIIDRRFHSLLVRYGFERVEDDTRCEVATGIAFTRTWWVGMIWRGGPDVPTQINIGTLEVVRRKNEALEDLVGRAIDVLIEEMVETHRSVAGLQKMHRTLRDSRGF